MKETFLKMLSALKKIFGVRNIIILVLLIILVVMKYNSCVLDSLTTNSKFELNNRNEYSFCMECRQNFVEFHERKYFYNELIDLVRNETGLTTYVSFNVAQMPGKFLKRGRERVIINDYFSNDLFREKTFYSLTDNREESRDTVLAKYGINPENLNRINDKMRRAGIQVVNKFPDSIELCRDTPVGNANLDEYTGYLNCASDEQDLKEKYAYISRIDDNWYFFLKNVKK